MRSTSLHLSRILTLTDLIFREDYGPVVRVRMAGQKVVYVTSSEVIHSVYRDPKAFAFSSLRQEMAWKIFGADPAIARQYEEAQVFAAHARFVPVVPHGSLCLTRAFVF